MAQKSTVTRATYTTRIFGQTQKSAGTRINCTLIRSLAADTNLERTSDHTVSKIKALSLLWNQRKADSKDEGEELADTNPARFVSNTRAVIFVIDPETDSKISARAL